jgi:hypothetical protein
MVSMEKVNFCCLIIIPKLHETASSQDESVRPATRRLRTLFYAEPKETQEELCKNLFEPSGQPIYRARLVSWKCVLFCFSEEAMI